jgi:hypothetical protein
MDWKTWGSWPRSIPHPPRHQQEWAAEQVNQPSQSAAKPSILFVYFTYTKQTLRVVEAMAGCSAAAAVT